MLYIYEQSAPPKGFLMAGSSNKYETAKPYQARAAWVHILGYLTNILILALVQSIFESAVRHLCIYQNRLETVVTSLPSMSS